MEWVVWGGGVGGPERGGGGGRGGGDGEGGWVPVGDEELTPAVGGGLEDVDGQGVKEFVGNDEGSFSVIWMRSL